MLGGKQSLNRIYCPHCYTHTQFPTPSSFEGSQVCGFCGEPFDGPQSQLTWQKVVETPSRPIATYPPRPRQPLQSWPLLRHIPYGWFSLSRFTAHPKNFFWVLIILLFIFTATGAFGLAELSPHIQQAAATSLWAQPAGDINVGRQLTLMGSGFTPDGEVGLFIDTTIPIADVGGHTFATADANGEMKDVIVISADWIGGRHVITAEDAHTHLSLTTQISVIGGSGPLAPAHLHVSMTSLNLGPGDQAINTVHRVTLSNTGAGQIVWQATASVPWLMLSPTRGTVSLGVPIIVMVAVDRANLSPDTYSADVLFSSNIGNSTLPITMQVLPLQAVHEAVLQLTPAVLAFTGVDGSSQPDPQVITMSNPGGGSLNWQAVSSASWLTLPINRGTVIASGSDEIKTTINNSNLLPGTYYATITFNGTGSVAILHAPQQVFVNVTITPGCGLQLSPGVLDFTSTYPQAVPAAKITTITQTEACSAPIHWSAQSNDEWLSISQKTGSTPLSPLISVDTTGMQPGSSRNGSITFTYNHGTQVLLVHLTRGTAFDPGLSVAESMISYTTTVGDENAVVQPVKITNTGESTLTWKVAASTYSAGHWLSVDKSGGQLGARQSTVLNVSADGLKTLAAGQYTGLLTITGTDALGHTVPGSPQNIPVHAVLNSACSLQVSPNTLNFYGAGIPTNTNTATTSSTTQNIEMTAGPTCSHALNWTASIMMNGGGSWLKAGVSSGVLAPHTSASIPVSVNLAGLLPGSYQGAMTISAGDSGNNNKLVSSKTISVSLTIQPPCTLQVASKQSLTLSPSSTVVAPSQTFTVGVVGTCSGNVTVNATPVFATKKWFTVTPVSVVVTGGHTATFTVAANAANLVAGSHYTDAISLSALDAGMAIVGSQQIVAVSISIPGIPSLSANLASQSTDTQDGIVSQAIVISNIGNTPLDWTASLTDVSLAIFSLPKISGTSLQGGASTTIALNLDTSDIAAGPYTATVLISGH